jgi:asparagine synthase (glutamine-hydrolysing)
MISGVPINLRGSLEKTLHTLVGQDCDLASRALAELDGAFAALFWDNSQQKMAIITDFLGMQPLYCVHREGLLLLATEAKGITASGLVNLDLDPLGWGSLLARGHMMGDHTLLQAVKRVEAGTVLSWEPTQGNLKASPYWRWPERRPIQRVEDVDTGDLVELLRRCVRGYSAHYAGGTVLLSGGLDSRLLTSILLQEHLHPKALILEHPDESNNADGKFAVEAARHLRIEYEVAKP